MNAAQSMITVAEIARETERVGRELLEQESSYGTATSAIYLRLWNFHKQSISMSLPLEGSCLCSAFAVEGRVFRRLQRFQLLPSELKVQSDMVAAYLLAPKVHRHVFERRTHWWQHPLHLAKARTFVQGRRLLQAILEYIVLSQAANKSLHHAQKLAESLVLGGFLTPALEAPNGESLGELYVRDDAFYELVAPDADAIVPISNVPASVTAESSSLPHSVVASIQQQSPQTRRKQLRRTEGAFSVWSVTDGATRAGFIGYRTGKFHFRSMLGISSKVSDCYAVVNKTKHESIRLSFLCSQSLHWQRYSELAELSTLYGDAGLKVVAFPSSASTEAAKDEIVAMDAMTTVEIGEEIEDMAVGDVVKPDLEEAVDVPVSDPREDKKEKEEKDVETSDVSAPPKHVQRPERPLPRSLVRNVINAALRQYEEEFGGIRVVHEGMSAMYAPIMPPWTNNTLVDI
ncbi:Glutathione peroxidase [Phytophthora megakarya]|uniref:Glutathione peroxidase n=1 Tax=Phytophthora megakarya TaxID=4795 RepID=A0A225WBT0_9STRA|nr:Glutathione peroxidase [Phytophthora megakarya]